MALAEDENGLAIGLFNGLEVSFPGTQAKDLYGDVLMIVPGHKIASRLIRQKSRHNTLLFTEQCDQLCVMCSQPPKRIQDQWRLRFYKEAVRLADPGITIGISGGEPTMQRELFFDLIQDISENRPDIGLHILTNAQHFVDADIPILKRIHERTDVLWGVPLYAPNAEIHDRVVNKDGAFEILMPNFYRLASAQAKIELRTVLTGLNYPALPKLADLISKDLFFIKVWAIMGLEPIGFAKAFMGDLFVDHSAFFDPLEHALDIAAKRRLVTTLYNIPLCTVPARYRKYCADTISDWKKKFVPECESCSQRSSCTGFFEWYNNDWAYAGVHSLGQTGEAL
ncbi:His-Xaa-Ser system radical SAM maturase HxsC [Minwuia sp. IMCC3009]|uniref:His-Xaa-Ser system radical SAM maturase HxsC n=1 Tax=Minwuia sp. IMCC3009 TaxID=3040674 RepID=UPI0024788825|nr:His-Xaa-Ser system radical SAM maturase HxsC [Minwuia sp. IMCC3009]